MLKALGNSCTVPALARAIYGKTRGKKVSRGGHWARKTTQARLGLDPETHGPLPSLSWGVSEECPDQPVWILETKWIWYRCEISFEGEISFESRVGPASGARSASRARPASRARLASREGMSFKGEISSASRLRSASSRGRDQLWGRDQRRVEPRPRCWARSACWAQRACWAMVESAGGWDCGESYNNPSLAPLLVYIKYLKVSLIDLIFLSNQSATFIT